MIDNSAGSALPFVADITPQPGDVVFATDKRGRLVFWNPEAEDLFGLSAEEVAGKPLNLVCVVDPGGPVVDLSAVLSGHDFVGGLRCQSRTGAELALYVFATVGRNQAGEPAGVVFVGREVTGLWRIEEAARTSADKYRLLFENSLDSVAIADMDGRVIEANPACLRLYGYTADRVKGINLADMVAPEDRSAAAEAMASLAAGKQVTRTIRMRRKDGTGFVVDLVASVMAVGGERRIMSVTRDVSERARAEQAREQSERMYRAVFESANDGIFIESVDGHILDVNRNGCELLGYTRAELVRMSVSDLVPAEARAWLPHITDAILRDKTFRVEAVNVHKGGRLIPVEMSASTMVLDAGTVVLVIVRDITERKRAEQALRREKESAQSYLELAGVIMVALDQSGVVRMVNRKGCEILGCAAADVVGRDWFETFVPARLRVEVKRTFERLMRGELEPVEHYENPITTMHGEERLVAWHNALLHDDAGHIVGTLSSGEDITERMAAEQALRESEESFRALAENASDGVAIADEHGRHVFANRRAGEILGYPVERLLGMTFRDFLTPGDREMIEERFAHRLREEEAPSHYEMTVVRGDGSGVLVEGGVSRTTWHGRPAVLVMLRDIAGRKAAERALASSEQRYRNLVESSPDGIAVYQDGVVVLANLACALALGYDGPDALVGRPASEFVNPEDRSVVGERESALAGRPQGAAEVPLRVRYRRRDGTWQPVEVVGAMTTWQGRPAIQVMVRRVDESKGT